MLYHLFVNALGFIGNILFGIGCVPTAWRAWREKKTDFPRDTAWLIGGACINFYAYLGLTYGFTWMTGPLGVIETGAYAVVILYSYFPGFRVGYCTREDGHDGPCNGWPRHYCPGYKNWKESCERGIRGGRRLRQI